MSEIKIFNNFSEAIDYIVDTLDEDERDLIKNGDPTGLHMALDRWIKSDYVFSDSTNINEVIRKKVKSEDPYYKDSPDEEINIHPDNLSGIIIDGLIDKLHK